jgi:hypothetical protein
MYIKFGGKYNGKIYPLLRISLTCSAALLYTPRQYYLFRFKPPQTTYYITIIFLRRLTLILAELVPKKFIINLGFTRLNITIPQLTHS